MRKNKYILIFAVVFFFNAIFVTLSFRPYKPVSTFYKPQNFRLTKDQQIAKASNAEKLIQLKIEQKIANLEK